MREFVIVAAYFLVVFLGGAILAPWVHMGVGALAEAMPAFKGLAGAPFHRYVTRGFMIIGVVGLMPLCRALGVKWADFFNNCGWRAGRGSLLRGMGAGFVSLAGVALLALVLGPREWRGGHSLGTWIEHLGKAGLAAVVVGSMEEMFFRGVLFGAFKRTMHWSGALLLSSAIYAILHFFERAHHAGPVDWASGFALLPRMLRGFGEVQMLVPGFFNLCVAGCLLGLAYKRTGNLWFSIGLHAGWIFWLKSYGFLTSAPGEASIWIWGTGKLTDGWICLAVLLSLWPFINQLKPYQNHPHS